MRGSWAICKRSWRLCREKSEQGAAGRPPAAEEPGQPGEEMLLPPWTNASNRFFKEVKNKQKSLKPKWSCNSTDLNGGKKDQNSSSERLAGLSLGRRTVGTGAATCAQILAPVLRQLWICLRGNQRDLGCQLGGSLRGLLGLCREPGWEQCRRQHNCAGERCWGRGRTQLKPCGGYPTGESESQETGDLSWTSWLPVKVRKRSRMLVETAPKTGRGLQQRGEWGRIWNRYAVSSRRMRKPTCPHAEEQKRDATDLFGIKVEAYPSSEACTEIRTKYSRETEYWT